MPDRADGGVQVSNQTGRPGGAMEGTKVGRAAIRP